MIGKKKVGSEEEGKPLPLGQGEGRKKTATESVYGDTERMWKEGSCQTAFVCGKLMMASSVR